MKTYIAIVVVLGIGITVAAAGFVSAGHEPVEPDQTYIHVIGSITTHDNGQICIEDMGENLNKITVTQATVRNTTFYHYRQGDKDVRIHVPELHSDEIVVYSNGENSLVNTLTGMCTTVDVTDSLVLAEYYLTISLNMPQGVEIVSGPHVADNPPAPGSGDASLSTTGDTLDLTSTTTTDEQPSDSKLDDFDVDEIVGDSSKNSTDNMVSNESVNELVNESVADQVDDTEERANDAVGSVRETVGSVQDVIETVLNGDSVTDINTLEDDTVIGSVGVPVGVIGLVVVYIRQEPE